MALARGVFGLVLLAPHMHSLSTSRAALVPFGHPARIAPLTEGADALLGLVGTEELLRERCGPVKSLGTAHLRHARHQLFGCRERLRAATHELADNIIDLGVQLGGWDGMIDEAQYGGARRGEI